MHRPATQTATTNESQWSGALNDLGFSFQNGKSLLYPYAAVPPEELGSESFSTAPDASVQEKAYPDR